MMNEEMKYIHGLQNNDFKIIQSIYDQYLPDIERFIVKNNGTTDHAFDIFQEALILVLQKSKAPDFELTCKFSVFLQAFCRRLWWNKLRKISGNEVTLAETMTYIDDFSIENAIHEAAQIELYREKLKELGKKCQELLNLFFEKTKMKIIADVMGYTDARAARQRKHQCVKQLIKKIREDNRYEELKD